MLYGIRQAIFLALRQREAIEVVAHNLKIAIMEAVVKEGPVLGDKTLKNIALSKTATDLVFNSFLTSCLALSKQMPNALLRGGLEALKSPEFKEYLLEIMVTNTVNYIISKAADIDPKGINLASLGNPRSNLLAMISQAFADTLLTKGIDSANEAVSNQWNEFIKAYPNAPTPLLSDEDIKLLTQLPPGEIEQKMNEMLAQKLENLTPGVTPGLPEAPPVESPVVTPIIQGPTVEAPVVTSAPPVARPGQAHLGENVAEVLRKKGFTQSFEDKRERSEGRKGLAELLDDDIPKNPTPK